MLLGLFDLQFIFERSFDQSVAATHIQIGCKELLELCLFARMLSQIGSDNLLVLPRARNNGVLLLCECWC